MHMRKPQHIVFEHCFYHNMLGFPDAGADDGKLRHRENIQYIVVNLCFTYYILCLSGYLFCYITI